MPVTVTLSVCQAYRELAARVVRQPQLNDPNADGHLQQVALLTKARDVLYETFGSVARRNNQVSGTKLAVMTFRCRP